MTNPSVNVLPSSLARESKTVYKLTVCGRPAKQLYCGSCAAPGGFVAVDVQFAFWLCRNCEGQWAVLAGTYTTSDEEFFRRVAEASRETYGRDLTVVEQLEALKDSTSPLYKLSKER